MDQYGKYVPTYKPLDYHRELFDKCFIELYPKRNEINFKLQMTNCVIQNHKIAKTIKEHLTKNMEHIPIHNYVHDFDINEEGVKKFAEIYDNSYMVFKDMESKPDEEEEE